MLWVEVINRGLDWVDLEVARRDLSGCLEAGRLEAATHRALLEDLTVLRRVYAAAALRRGSIAPGASQWLEAVTLRTTPPGRRAVFELPALRARRSGGRLPAALDELLSTALVELLGMSTAAVTAVNRCRGLVRAAEAAPVLDPADEAAFAALADLEAFVSNGWRQCARLVSAPRLGQYCRKACSNAAFVARKGARDPGYFAAKQASYRDRQRRREAATVASGAFSFID